MQQVTVIKLIPQVMRGKYKIGQHWAPAYRLKIAENIVNRKGTKLAKGILDTMGIDLLTDGSLKIRQESSIVYNNYKRI